MISVEDLKRVCEASSEIERCMNDIDFLCQKLNNLDPTFLKNYYRSEKEGPVVSIRKEVCKILLLGDIDSEKLTEIIENARIENGAALKTWTNYYRILNNLVNNDYKDVDIIMENFKNKILEKIEDEVKSIVWSFKGAQNQGASNYCIAFFNKEHKNQNLGIQLSFDVSGNSVRWTIWREQTKTREFDSGIINIEDFNIEDFENFIEENKNLILEDCSEKNESESLTFVEAAKIVLSDNGNNPMSANEIWEEIERRSLVKTEGSTPVATLNVILMQSSIESPIKNNNKKKRFFKIVENKPNKYVLLRYMSNHTKEALIENGFVTNDILGKRVEYLELKLNKIQEFLDKNFIKINI
jgi:hypothetical protein